MLNPRTLEGWLPAVDRQCPWPPTDPSCWGRWAWWMPSVQIQDCARALPPPTFRADLVGPSPVPRPGLATVSPTAGPNTGVRSPTPQVPGLAVTATATPPGSIPSGVVAKQLEDETGGVPAFTGSIVSHSATSICEQRNPFQSPCDPPLTVPVLRSLSTERTPSVGNSMPRASNGPLSRQLEARPSPSREGKGHLLRGERRNKLSPRPARPSTARNNVFQRGVRRGLASQAPPLGSRRLAEGEERRRHSPTEKRFSSSGSFSSLLHRCRRPGHVPSRAALLWSSAGTPPHRKVDRTSSGRRGRPDGRRGTSPAWTTD